MTLLEIKRQVDALRSASVRAQSVEERVTIKVALLRLDRQLVDAMVREMGR